MTPQKMFSWQGRTFVSLMMVAVLLTLGACTSVTAPGAGSATEGPGSTAAAESGEITLKMMCWEGAIGSRELVTDALIPGFLEQHPNVTIEYEAMPWSEYWTKIGAVAAAGGMPDIYCNSVAYLWDHANRGLSANIQPFFDADLNEDDYFMELTAVERYPDANADLYGFPFRWVVGALFYNKQLFDEAGLDYPTDEWTYADVLAAAQQLTKDTDGDGEIDQWGVLATTDHIFLDSVIKSNGGQVINDDYTQCMLTEPEAVAAIQWMVDLVHVHKVSPSPAVAQGFAQGIFPSGKVAMMVTGSYQTVPWSQIEDFEWDVVMQPAGTVSRVVYGGPDSLSISMSSQHKEMAWEFLKYMISPETQARGDLIGLGSLPILREAAYADAWLNAAGQPGNARIFADSGPYVVGADFGSQWIEWRATIMNNELAMALLNQRSVEESAAAACQAIDAVLATIEVRQ
jgi:multiple sugar transport system substrate-binding protein